MNRLFATFHILFIFSIAFSQQSFDIIAIEDVIEEISENSDNQLDYASLLEDLWYYYENPVNINSCSYEDLAKLHFMTDYQIRSLLDYISKRGPLTSIYEVQYIYGFNEKLARYLGHFITLGTETVISEIRPGEMLNYGRHDFYIVGSECLQEKAGFSPVPDSVLSVNPDKSRYLGDPYRLRAKYHYQFRDRMIFSIQAEKDPGEEFLKGSNTAGFDFYSGYLQVNDVGMLKNIIIGDYYLQFGQGLTLFSGLAFGKSAFSTDVIKRVTGIRRFSSADENTFFRGMATTIRWKMFDFSLFFSKKKVDANLHDTIDDGEDEFSSFQGSGLHRTPSENEDEKSISEVAVGTNILFKAEKLRIGGTLVRYGFGGTFNPSEKLYHLYDFRGSSLLNAGIDYRYRLNNLELFGEVSYGNDNWAILNGILLQAGELTSFTLLYRNYSKGFYAYRNNPFSEYASKNNEQGLYLGTTVYPIKFFKVTAYCDVFKSPWLRYNVSAPSAGRDCLIQVDFTPGRHMEFYFRYKSETKSKNNNDDAAPAPLVEDYTVNKIRIHAGYDLFKQINFRNRLEYNVLKPEEGLKESGWYFSQDIGYAVQKLPLSFWLRFAVFDCESYDTRVYAYENTVPFSFSVPFFYHKGIRFYSMIKCSLNKYLTFWFRYGITQFRDQDFIGTGLDRISGNIESDVDVMLRLKF
jgi:hypothetical protein